MFFIANREDYWVDSWTYGNYRQYLYTREDRDTQCCRIIIGPIFGKALMKTVGPINKNGMRVFPGEEKL